MKVFSTFAGHDQSISTSKKQSRWISVSCLVTNKENTRASEAKGHKRMQRCHFSIIQMTTQIGISMIVIYYCCFCVKVVNSNLSSKNARCSSQILWKRRLLRRVVFPSCPVVMITQCGPTQFLKKSSL